MQKLILLIAFIGLALVACNKGTDTPENDPCLDQLMKYVSGTFAINSGTWTPAGSQLNKPYQTQASITIDGLDCEVIHFDMTPIVFDATCQKVQDSPITISGVSADGKATIQYADDTKKMLVDYTNAAGDKYHFELSK